MTEETGLPQQVVGQDNGLVNVVSRLLFPDNRADQHPIGLRCQPGSLHQPLMSGVGNIAALVSHDPAPAPLLQCLPKLSGGLPETVKGWVDVRGIYQRHLAGHELLLVGQSPLDTRVGDVCRPINLCRQKLPVVGENLPYFKNGQWLSLVSEEYGVAFLQSQFIDFGL